MTHKIVVALHGGAIVNDFIHNFDAQYMKSQ